MSILSRFTGASWETFSKYDKSMLFPPYQALYHWSLSVSSLSSPVPFFLAPLLTFAMHLVIRYSSSPLKTSNHSFCHSFRHTSIQTFIGYLLCTFLGLGNTKLPNKKHFCPCQHSRREWSVSTQTTKMQCGQCNYRGKSCSCRGGEEEHREACREEGGKKTSWKLWHVRGVVWPCEN